jgi:dipeptidyl aminopeptidase/acylaminoacyl peptidase
MRTLVFLSALLALAACSQIEPPARYSIEQFYNNTRISGGAFSDDETRMLVSSDETGISNVFEINIEDASRKQITFSEVESFFAVDYVPGTGQILYSADKGGNEINHIYLLREDGSSIDLTPAENEKAGFAGWSEDKKSMFYISNKRDPRFFDLYKMRISDWEAEMIYQNDEGFDIADLSHDESLFILGKAITTSNTKLYLYERNSGRMTEISDEPGEYYGSGFSRDDQYFNYITNAGREFKVLMQYEIETGTKEVLFEADWDVMYSYLSENEKYRVIAINEDGKNNLIVTLSSTGQPVDFPDVPDGDIISVGIAESEDLMRLSIGTSKAPSNIYIYAFESGELKKLTETLNPEINTDHLVSAEVIRFESFDGLEIPAIYYKPHSTSAQNKIPALVWVHGGPGGQSRVGYRALIQYLVNHGYALLAVNNRGSSGYGRTFYQMDDLNHGDRDLKDCIWGKNWLQSQDYIDADKIGIIGGSYGGYMVMAALAFAPEEFDVGVNIFGVTNWLRTLKSIPPYWESFREALYKELGDPYSDDSLRLYEISPLFHAENVTKPLLVLQGANDPRVLQIESDEIVEAVRKNGVPVEYLVFPDEGHGFMKKENEIKAYGQVLEFLDTFLKGEGVVEIEPVSDQ